MEQDYNWGIKSLRDAYFTQLGLASQGTIGEKISRNYGKDISLKGDWESEEVVIGCFKDSGLPIRIISEEHGQIDLTKESKLKYLAVLDGFDGSSGLAKNSWARGGTMLAIANNLNPKYEDFIFGGLTDFSTGKIIYAIKGEGVFLLKEIEENCRRERIEIERPKQIKKIYLDDKTFYPDYKEGITSGMDEITECVRKYFSDKLKGKFELSGLVSSSAMCLDLILGKVDAVGGVRAKGVFEPPAEYVLLKEIWGRIFGLNKKTNTWYDIKNDLWLKDRERYKTNFAPLLRVGSKEVEKELIEILIN